MAADDGELALGEEALRSGLGVKIHRWLLPYKEVKGLARFLKQVDHMC